MAGERVSSVAILPIAASREGRGWTWRRSARNHGRAAGFEEMRPAQGFDMFEGGQDVGGSLQDERTEDFFPKANLGGNGTAALGHAVDLVRAYFETGEFGRFADDFCGEENTLSANA